MILYSITIKKFITGNTTCQSSRGRLEQLKIKILYKINKERYTSRYFKMRKVWQSSKVKDKVLQN